MRKLPGSPGLGINLSQLERLDPSVDIAVVEMLDADVEEAVYAPSRLDGLPNSGGYLKWYSLLQHLATPERVALAAERLDQALGAHPKHAIVLAQVLDHTRAQACGEIS